MDAFEENLQTFGSTIYGTEMKDSLKRCFDLLYVTLSYYEKKMQSLDEKIKVLEKKGGD